MKSKILSEIAVYDCRLVQFEHDIVKIPMKKYRIRVIYNGICYRRVDFLLGSEVQTAIRDDLNYAIDLRVYHCLAYAGGSGNPRRTHIFV